MTAYGGANKPLTLNTALYIYYKTDTCWQQCNLTVFSVSVHTRCTSG